jgi:hypothetical protein
VATRSHIRNVTDVRRAEVSELRPVEGGTVRGVGSQCATGYWLMLCEDYIVRNTSHGEGLLNQPEPSRIVPRDDHPLFRAALRQMVTQRDPTLEVVAEAGDGQEALEACRRFGPDLILMDLSMPKVGGIEATRAITRRCPARWCWC